MRIAIKGTPIERLCCYLENKYEDYTQKVWSSKPHVAKCSICGKELHSMNANYVIKDEYSPEQCGWVQVRYNKIDRHPQWICHSCHGHHSEHYISKEVHEIVKQLRYQEGLKDGKELPKEVSYKPGDIVLVKSHIKEIEFRSKESVIYHIESPIGGWDLIPSNSKGIIKFENVLYHLAYIINDSKNFLQGKRRIYEIWNEGTITSSSLMGITPKEIIYKIGEIDLETLKQLIKIKEGKECCTELKSNYVESESKS